MALDVLLSDLNVNLNLIDPLFIREIEEHLHYLRGYVIETIYLDDLQCIEYTPSKFTGVTLHDLNNGPEFKYLMAHGIGEGKQNRVCSEGLNGTFNDLKIAIESNGYPLKCKYIVLFENERIIREGKEKAAMLRYLYGNIEVPILVLKFKDNYSKHRGIGQAILKEYLKYHLKYRLKSIIPDKIRRFLEISYDLLK
jgi:hypothetical protein